MTRPQDRLGRRRCVVARVTITLVNCASGGCCLDEGRYHHWVGAAWCYRMREASKYMFCVRAAQP
jgi:hypothetical protein